MILECSFPLKDEGQIGLFIYPNKGRTLKRQTQAQSVIIFRHLSVN